MNVQRKKLCKIWKAEHLATAKNMLGEENEAEEGQGENKDDDREDGIGGFDHDNEDVSNCGDDSDTKSRNGQDMLGLRSPVCESPMTKMGQKGVFLV